jgi:hypothetical protein
MGLEIGFDELLYSLGKGLTIEKHRNGIRLVELEKVKAWKNRNGYEFHIYGGEHFILGKPHFHLLKKSEDFEGKYFFQGEEYSLKNSNQLPKKVKEALIYFLESPTVQEELKKMWNDKNPNLKIP